jgi:hypothetical protein
MLDALGAFAVAGAGELDVGLQVPAQIAGVGGGQRQDKVEGLGALAADFVPFGGKDVTVAVDDQAGFVGFGHWCFLGVLKRKA